MINAHLLSGPEKESYEKSKAKVDRHNLILGNHHIHFPKLFADAKNVKELATLVYKAMQPKTPSTTGLTKREETAKLEAELGSATSSTSPRLTSPTPKPPKTSATIITVGCASYIAPPTVTVDRYAGLSPFAKKHAVYLYTNGVGTGMSGPSQQDTDLTQADLDDLRNWVLKQETTGGQQKWITNVGQGTGLHSHKWQFKVTGFGTCTTSSSAPTWHLWINNGLT